MSDEYVPDFKIGEIAVLLHQNGGRLFEVGQLPDKPVPTGEHYMVGEPMQNRTRWHEVSTAWLVKVKNREEAIKLVAILEFIQQGFERDRAKLEAECNKARRNAVAHYSMEYQP